jgi:hypothetical protein
MTENLEYDDTGKLYRKVRDEARQHMTDQLTHMMADRRKQVRGHRETEALAASALGRLLKKDSEFSDAIGKQVSAAADAVTGLEKSDRTLPGLSRERFLALTHGCSTQEAHVRDGVIVITTSKDTRLDVFSAPYRDSWVNADSGRHTQAVKDANKTTGRLQLVYTVGKEGGSTFLGAGVAVAFMRNVAGHPPGQGPAGVAQVRTYTPYDYRWHDISYLGPAHQHAGFGVTVWSSDLNGGSSRMDQNHTPWRWQDGTDWYKEHNNGSWNGFDSDTALNFGDQAPYFPIEPGRLYVAWVWCFADADAHGADLTSAGFAQGQIVASVNTIVVGQQ